jgi:hypothetical protein
MPSFAQFRADWPSINQPFTDADFEAVKQARSREGAGDDLPCSLPPAWMKDARCADPKFAHVNFFDDNPRDAIEVCLGCLVRAECAAYADQHQFAYGTWGGIPAEKRIAIRRKRAKAA